MSSTGYISLAGGGSGMVNGDDHSSLRTKALQETQFGEKWPPFRPQLVAHSIVIGVSDATKPTNL